MDENPYQSPRHTGFSPPRPETEAFKAWLKDRALLLFFGALPMVLYVVIGVPIVFLLHHLGFLP